MKKSDRFTPEECIAAYMAVMKCSIIPAEMKTALGAKIIRNSDIKNRKKGRPKKPSIQSIDVMRANVVDYFRDTFPDIKSDIEAVDFAVATATIGERLAEPKFRQWLPQEDADEIDALLAEGSPVAEFAKLFGNMPPTETVIQSISRGRSKVRKT